jgi:hypothetical protein
MKWMYAVNYASKSMIVVAWEYLVRLFVVALLLKPEHENIKQTPNVRKEQPESRQ